MTFICSKCQKTFVTSALITITGKDETEYEVNFEVCPHCYSREFDVFEPKLMDVVRPESATDFARYATQGYEILNNLSKPIYMGKFQPAVPPAKETAP